jgi:hypothetical protein
MVQTWWRGDWTRLVAAILASDYFFYYASTASDWHFIDNLDLIIHEAGHWIFLPFGDFVHILGGSLFQILFPCIYVGYFYFRRDYFSASLLLFWVGVNFVNVSVYAGDAQAMQLPLLGGDGVIHDWNYILLALHLIRYTPQIASCIYGIGLILIVFATAAAIYWSQFRTPVYGDVRL